MNQHPQTQRRPAGKAGLRDHTHNTSNRPQLTASPAALLLPRLHGMRKVGSGWIANCPAHEDRSPSLSITEGDDGRLLLHCFAGCQVHDILAAVGLTVSDLFVRKDLRGLSPAERSQLRQAALLPRWRAALSVLVHEAHVMLETANKLGDGYPLTEDEHTRLRVGTLRIFDAAEVLRNDR
ncbi:MAG: hypothetical protein KGM46_06675 [Pseudomonadota bacterium]|nr:hypothetical protein [Xanthomonadaceae bacterium]MDE3210409.1 hypothetical protein [Pseudomonadota bacterium]